MLWTYTRWTHASKITTTTTTTRFKQVCLALVSFLSVESMWSALNAEDAGTAKRWRERRFRQFLRHERLTVAMLLAETQHHAAPRGQNMARSRGGGKRDAQRHGPDDSSHQSGKHNVIQLGRRRGVVNLETIIDMQLWCRTWPPNGSSRIRANTNFSANTKELAKVLGARTGSLKSFTLTFPWNSAKPVKIFPGIIVRRQLLSEQYAEWKKVRLQYCCN